MQIKNIKNYQDLMDSLHSRANLNNQIFDYIIKNYLDYTIINGDLEELETQSTEIFQTYIINKYDAEFLSYFTDEFVFYCEELDLYLWGITFLGCSFEDVPITLKDDDAA